MAAGVGARETRGPYAMSHLPFTPRRAFPYGRAAAGLFAAVLMLPLGACDQASRPSGDTEQASRAEAGGEAETARGRAVTVAEYGSWQSPVSADDLAGAALGFSDLQFHDGRLYWREFRPREEGRHAVMRLSADGSVKRVTPRRFDVRSRVHEYGGTPFLAAKDGVFFVNGEDQHMYHLTPGKPPAAVAAQAGLRYADCVADAGRGRLLCVREDHRGEGGAKNAIVALSMSGGDGGGRVLFADADFVAYPRLSPDGTRIAWLSWTHPDMPWDRVSLWAGGIGADGSIVNAKRLNPGREESVLQPQWSADGALYFVSDRSGWWNLYRWKDGTVSAVHEREAEFGGPLWTLGRRFFDFLPDGRILARYVEEGHRRLAVVDPETGGLTLLDLDGEPGDFVVAGNTVYAVLHYTDDLPAIVRYDPGSGETEVLRAAGERGIGTDAISEARPVTFPTGGGDHAYAYYYPPVNPAFKGPADAKPPLIVTVHGGPTGAADRSFSLDTQYWTTRGFAVADIDYRGSTGYGRGYRRKLYGKWGVADVEDAVNGARYLAAQGLADPGKLLIRGGSAGGFVVLAALAFHDVFAAGANYFGVSDLEMLAGETHKFESRYMDQLIGPYPERRDLYRERSPIHSLEGLNEPLIIFQGLEDKVVPPNQSEMIFSALKKKGVTVAYLPFAGEQHGFRKAETRRRARQAELYFYGKVLGFTPAGEFEPVEIHNLR